MALRTRNARPAQLLNPQRELARGGLSFQRRSMARSDPTRITDQLCAIYDESVANLRSALIAFVERGERPDPKKRAQGSFAYPELRIDYHPTSPPPATVPRRACARLNDPGCYASSIARPDLFRDYLS